MCGIAGFLESSPHSSPEALQGVALRMASTLFHRGPDDGGVWTDADVGVALSMRRLAILDVSLAGHQPMQSLSGRYVIVFNGEIYNCADLRLELMSRDKTLAFRGHSDTEVMLAAFEQWGVLESVRKFNGMFAFALWDRRERILMLGRDRFGEKPLYYGVVGATLVFASELKALRLYPGFCNEIDLGSVALYLRHNCVPSPYSIYLNTRKLPPATVLSVSAANLMGRPQSYWSLREVAETGAAAKTSITEEEAVNALEVLLRDAVKIRMYSDVPLGAFFSGGIDSSTVVALMQAQSGIPIKTFTIGFRETDYSEAGDALRVAQHLRTDHRELHVTPREAMDVVPRLPQIYDEPFADSSQIPTFLVAQFARQNVIVSLSGDGGDEIFGGYNRHTWCGPLWNKLRALPLWARRLGAGSILALSPASWDMLFRRVGPLLPSTWQQRVPGYKMHKLAQVMGSRNEYEVYCRLASHWFHPETVVANGREPPTLTTNGDLAQFPTATEQMMYCDSVTYLPDDILVKLDRATMAVGLEGRVPFLDHRIAEFVWQLPLELRVRGQTGKWILRQVLYRYVSRKVIERPKFGFGIPLHSWLRGPLRDWCEALLDERRLQRDGFFDPRPIRRVWQEHLSGRRCWEYHLWDVLMFQAWLEENRGAPRIDQNPCTRPMTIATA
jgi:asparagine synthase (glutamine-hydrolysing)